MLASIKKPETFVEFLDQIKTEKNFSFSYELSEFLGITSDVISRIYSGKKAPNATYVKQIATALELAEDSQDYYLLLKLAHDANLVQEQSDQRKKRERK
jgi:transcriptional regulator with XRE-family HTH domain